MSKADTLLAERTTIESSPEGLIGKTPLEFGHPQLVNRQSC